MAFLVTRSLLCFKLTSSCTLDHRSLMARLPNLYGVSEALSSMPKLPHHLHRIQKKPMTRLEIVSKKKMEVEYQQQPTTTRRASLCLVAASIALCASSSNGVSLAEDNGYWVTSDPIPIPPIYNQLGNEKTGTRSFVRSGIYIADIGVKGRMYRLKKYAFDLLALGDLIGQDAWNYVRKYLRLKGTFMYYDFDNVISAAPVSDKQPLMDLANRLFDNVEKLEVAVKKKDLPETKSLYQDTTVILQEVMSRMA